MHTLEKHELETLKTVSTLDQLADVALSSLSRMKVTYQDIVQICGPMSTGGCGSFEGNMARFNRAIEVARMHDLAVYNQLLFQDAMVRICKWKEGQPYPTDILTIFHGRVLSSGYITKGLFLSGWETSVGACWEREFLTSFNIPVEEYPAEWLV